MQPTALHNVPNRLKVLAGMQPTALHNVPKRLKVLAGMQPTALQNAEAVEGAYGHATDYTAKRTEAVDCTAAEVAEADAYTATSLQCSHVHNHG